MLVRPVHRRVHRDVPLEQPGSVGQNESTHAVDLSILSGSHVRWVSQAMVNTNSANRGVDAQHLGWISDFIYDSDKFTYEVSGKFLGNKVDLSHTGFEPQVDRWSGLMSTTIRSGSIRTPFRSANQR